jgi:PAS domain-containing protein
MTGRLRLAPFPSHAVAVHELLRNSTEAGLELDMNGVIRAASSAVAGLLGWRASDLSGHDLRQFVFAEDVSILDELLAHPGPSAPTVEIRVMRHRRSRPVSLEISVVRTPTSIRVHLQDVLSWRVVELALRGQSRLGTAIADGTPTMLLRLDQQCRCEHANAAWSEATGTRLPDEPGLSWLRSLDEGTLVAFRDALPALCVGTSFQHEALVRHLDGYVSRYSIAVAPIVDEQRAFSGFLFVGSDQGALNADELTLIAATAKFAPLDYSTAAGPQAMEAAELSPAASPARSASLASGAASQPIFPQSTGVGSGPMLPSKTDGPSEPMFTPLVGSDSPPAPAEEAAPALLLKAQLASQRGLVQPNPPASVTSSASLFMMDDEPASPWPVEIPLEDDQPSASMAATSAKVDQFHDADQSADHSQYRPVQPVSVEPDPIMRLALASVLAAARASASFELLQPTPDGITVASEISPTDRAAALLDEPDPEVIHAAKGDSTPIQLASADSTSVDDALTSTTNVVTNDHRSGQVFISESAKEQLIDHLDGLHLDGMGGVISVALIFIDVLATGSEGLEDRRYDLKILERRLRTAVREHEYAAPLPDQGFVVAARGSFGSGDLEALVLRLMGRLSAPLRGHSQNGSPKLCVAAVRSAQGEVEHELIARAERARAQSIGTGPGSIVLN